MTLPRHSPTDTHTLQLRSPDSALLQLQHSRELAQHGADGPPLVQVARLVAPPCQGGFQGRRLKRQQRGRLAQHAHHLRQHAPCRYGWRVDRRAALYMQGCHGCLCIRCQLAGATMPHRRRQQPAAAARQPSLWPRSHPAPALRCCIAGCAAAAPPRLPARGCRPAAWGAFAASWQPPAAVGGEQRGMIYLKHLLDNLGHLLQGSCAPAAGPTPRHLPAV